MALPPRPPRTAPALEDRAPGELADEDRYEQCRVTDVDWAAVTARWVQFDEVGLERCSLAGATLDDVVISHARLRSCDVANAAFREGGIHRTVVSASKLTGASFAESRLADLLVEDCAAELTDFRFARLRRVAFRGCDLREVDFHGAELEHVTFAGCNLTGAAFDQVKIEAVDLREARLEDLRGIGGLTGAVVEPGQLVALAPMLATALGLQVRGQKSP